MFPIADARGRIIAFGGRGLDADAKPKYINTGETPLFSKGHLLYNFAHRARPPRSRRETIIVAEGYMDVIALVRAGFDYAVAPLGTALTEDQLAAAVAQRRRNRSCASTATRRGFAPRSAPRGWRCRI